MKRIAVLLAALLLVCSLTSCARVGVFVEGLLEGWEESTHPTFEVEELNISLDGIFTRQDALTEGYDVAFVSMTSVVMVSRVTYEELGYETDPRLNAEQLAAVYASATEAEVTVSREEGVIYFTDNATVADTEFTYFYTFYTSARAYWVVAMYCPAEDYEERRSDFIKWARSVTFVEEAFSDTPDTEAEDVTEPTGITHPDITEDGITFISLGDGTCKIKGADKTMEGRITVPAESPYGDVVTTVATGAFKGFRDITSVSLPDTVTVIKSSAFQGCGALRRVDMPPEITEFGKAMFEGCGELQRVVLPRGMTEIPAMTFQTCVSLTSVEYQGDVITAIGANAFNGCRSLWELSIPAGLETIGSSAFQNCWPVVYYGGSPQEWERVEINPTNNGGIIGASVIFD